MPSAWRIVKRRYAGQAFDGEGARRSGGRWNSPGTAVVYTAGSISLAVLELAVHLQRSAVLASYVLIRVHFDDELVERLDPDLLPDGWRRMPAPPALQQIGDSWVRDQRSLVLAVPSAIVPEERNYLIDPRHPDFARLRVEAPQPYELDPRLAGS